jgi:hypothetical protein
MIKKITLLLLVLTNLGLAQTVPETLLLTIGQGISETDFPSSSIRPKFHNGLIFIKSDTIKGQIKVVGKRVYYFNDSVEKSIKLKNKTIVRKVALVVFFPFISKDPKKNFIKTKKVTAVRLFAADTLITKNDYTDFIHIGKSSSIYRRIYSGSIQIFDHDFCTNENPGYINDALTVLDNGKRMDMPYDSPKKYLIKCINKKFQKDFKTSDFRHIIDVIYWLKLNDYIDPNAKNNNR